MDDGCNGSQNNSGCPIYEAKEAAKNFKDIILGTSPDGNVSVGTTALRGCFRANPQTATAPKPTSDDLCVLHDSSSSSWVVGLGYDATTLDTHINNIYSEGGSGTNVCGGISKGWEILEGSGNHEAEEDNLRFLVLLSDGDNNYYGHYTYQSTPYPSPHTYQSYPCQPPSSCSSVGGESTGSDPCQDGVYSPAVTIASDLFDRYSSSQCPTSWNSDDDYGWNDSAWTPSASNASRVTSDSPHDFNCHVRLGGSGSICRSIDLTGYNGATLRYWAKRNSWSSSGDDAWIQVSTTSNACTNGAASWTTVQDLNRGEVSTSYNDHSEDISSYVGGVIYIRFQGSMSSTSEYLFVDTITVEAGDTGSSNGYVNGHNGSPASCSSAVKRERQMDILTWDLAKAIEADGIEIIIVGFGVCDPDTSDPAITYTDTQCNSQIGNTDHDDTADERLLKCMASSTSGTNDHYYYAASATELPGIFTQIASQIAHRLIE
jgi:hypothetical protein